MDEKQKDLLEETFLNLKLYIYSPASSEYVEALKKLRNIEANKRRL